jgi:hypothetical protein
MSTSIIFDKSSTQGATRFAKKERSFDLSLPTLVSGIDATGNEFKEYTELASISAQEAVFWLDSGVTIGSKLKLSLDVPKTVLLESDLKLEITGRVTFVKADQSSEKKQLISLRLEKKYKINPLHSKKI